ncbi:MAG TPA: cell division protein ZapA [Candidatus Desulfovibrio gallistercoris]|uniref:cell division protein ZapA n=1 Tax=uncultured Desulfovibrio sp. TaxID=167968 RepID=UPI001F9537C7|nr:cell division protein ZapA [uncultured Desulfovibrio sp.]HJA75914.1 cell division protein ZapA [Candidatus Desulfovibrio gallistercoris]
MSPENASRLTVLGTDIFFRPGADLEKFRATIALVEERFADLKLRSHGAQTKDILLTYLALGLADDLLQAQKKQADVQNRIQDLLTQIEESQPL